MQPTTGSTNPTAEPVVDEQENGEGYSPFLAELVKKITNFAPEGVEEAFDGVDMPTVRVRMDAIVDVCRRLRTEPGHEFTLLSDLTAVDYLDREPRFEVVYHLYSFKQNQYVRLKVGVPLDPCRCPTLTGVYPGANWLEREVWDMFGIVFDGHPNLTRLVTPDGWEYFALRRDFPLQGPGMIKLYDSVTDVF